MASLATGCARGETASGGEAQIVLADVANETGDTLFDRSMLAAASVALQQTPFVRLYPRSRLPAMYRLMGIGRPDTALTFELAQEVAERAGVRWALGLSLTRRGDAFVVGARLTDAGQHRALAIDTTTPVQRADILSALDELLLRVRARVGEPRRNIAAHQSPLPRVTTRSLEALHSYADGAAAWDHDDFRRARELWERAVDLDTGFAMAFGALGMWHLYMHDRDGGERYFRDAFARADRLTDRELLVLRANRAAYGGTDSAIALARLMAQSYPSAATWYTLGTTLMKANHEEEAIAALQRALALDSLHATTFINLATAHARLGRWDRAIENYRRAEAVDAGALYHNVINNEYGLALVQVGRVADAESAFQRMTAAPTIADRALGLRSLAFLALWRGNVNDAAVYLRQATDATRQQHAQLSEARNHMLLVTVYRTTNRAAQANREIDQALGLTTAPTFEPTLLAVLAYQCEQLDRARDAATVAALVHARARADNATDQAAAAFADAAIALGRRRADSAVVYMRRTQAFPWPMLRLALAADAFVAARQSDSAVAALTSLVSLPGFGTEGEVEWLRAPLSLGDMLLAAGDTAAALGRYRAVVERWREAPLDFPDLVSARARLKVLAAGR